MVRGNIFSKKTLKTLGYVFVALHCVSFSLFNLFFSNFILNIARVGFPKLGLGLNSYVGLRWNWYKGCTQVLYQTNLQEVEGRNALPLQRSLRFLLHFRQRRNYTLSPTLLLTCSTKITLNIHHYQPIEACYTQLSCFYKELMSLHLTLPRLLRLLSHFRRRRNYTLSPTLLLTCMTKITLNIHHN